MPTPITMPQLGESVTEGTVARWLKDEGDRVERDEPLLEITTDKVNADMPSPVAGLLVRRSVEEGAVVPVGAEVAQIEESGAAAAASAAATSSRDTTPSPMIATASPAKSEQPEAADVSLAHVEQPEADGTEHRRYSPLVRKLAAEHAIDLARLVGTGLGGRVTKDDVLAFLTQQNAASAMPAADPASVAGRVTKDDVLAYVAEQGRTTVDGGSARIETRRPETVPPAAPPAQSSAVDIRNGSAGEPAMPGPGEQFVPLTPMRKGIAEHMVRSKHTAPHATTVTEVDMTRLVRWREGHKQAFRAREGVEITYVAFMVHAAIQALKAFPYLNASWGGDTIILKQAINIGIAVGMDDGLLVPVIHQADERSLVGIARAVADLAERARARKLTLQELQGGTFTVNNTGVFGSIVSTPVINQPQAAILSMEAIVKRPVVIDDAIAIRSMMNICLSFDHRIVDGLMAGRFSQAVRRNLEQFVLPNDG